MNETRSKRPRVPSPAKLLAVAVLLLAGLLCLQVVMPYERTRRLLESLERSHVWYLSEPSGPDWLRNMVGDETMEGFAVVTDVDVDEWEMDPHRLLSQLTSQRSIKRLTLRSTRSVVDEEFGRLACLPNLERLQVYGGLTDEGLAHLRYCRRLSHLAVAGAQISNDGLKCLESLTQLEALSFVECGDVTDRGLDCLNSLPHLTHVSIWHCPHITSEGLEALRRLKRLEWVEVSGDRITDEAMGLIDELQTLRSVSIFADISDVGLARLSSLMRLRLLRVRAPNVRGEGLLSFKHVETLKDLTLYGANFSDAVVPHLLELRQLEELTLSGTQVTDSGEERLVAALPNCTIHRLD